MIPTVVTDSRLDPPDDSATVGVFASLAEADEYALVALAMGYECDLVIDGPSFVLWAPAAQAEAVRAEFAAYAAEQIDLTPPLSAAPGAPGNLARGGWVYAWLWGLALLIVHHFQVQDPTFRERFANSAQDVFARGQWWRPFTALFLHADLPHLYGNLVFGAAFFVWVGSALGPRTGWLLILASGTLGNLLAAALHYPSAYHSQGASTAVFGALGLLTGVSTHSAWAARSRRPLIHILLPASSGLILLGWLGAGEAPTDVLSHLTGFLTGSLLGFLEGWRQHRPRPSGS